MKETKKINLVTLILIIILIVVAFISVKAIISNQSGDKKKGKLNIQTVQEMQTLVDKIYEGIELYPSIETREIDIKDRDSVVSYTGLSSAEKIDGLVISEPMITSQAYSMVLVKVKNPAEANSIAKEMNEKVNPNKWICVSAEKVYTTSSGNIVCLVMSAEDMAKPVYDNFKKIAGKIGEEYERQGDRGITEDFEVR